jgi:hypothetical protein
VGSRRYEAELEAMALLHITLQAELGTGFTSAIRIVGEPQVNGKG